MKLLSPLLLLAPLLVSAAEPTVYLEEMTSPELRARIASGTELALVPIGGTEQNGPQMVLGKHNVRSRLLAGQIAARLGRAVVAPVVAYVPEGSVHPPAAHMRYAGTISIPEAAFESLLEGAARSLCEHGLKQVFLLGDHGGYQKNLQRVAARFARDANCHVHALTEYYEATEGPYQQALKAKGFSAAEIGTHAGLADTALALAVDPQLVRADQLGRAQPDRDGVHGDPRKASAELGQLGVQRVVESSVAAIRAATRQ